jgi:hypothetical protein
VPVVIKYAFFALNLLACWYKSTHIDAAAGTKVHILTQYLLSDVPVVIVYAFFTGYCDTEAGMKGDEHIDAEEYVHLA